MARRDPNHAIHDKIRKMLHSEWDSFGAPEDEYDTYAGHAYGMLINGADTPSIAAYLNEVCQTELGVGGASATTNLDIAAKITALKEQLV